MAEVWDIFAEFHAKVIADYNFQTHALTLMNNHYHWNLSTPDKNVDGGMCFFQAQTTKTIAKEAGRINRIYGGRYGWSVLPTPDSFQRTYRYTHMNPVRANVCTDPLKYPWSTLVNHKIKIVEAEGFVEGMPKGPSAQAKWMLNLRAEDDEIRTRIALRRSVFKFPRKTSGYK